MRHAFNMKNVQKFQPGICLWLSERLTSSSRWETDKSRADSKPSLILFTRSAHMTGLWSPAVHDNCTHLINVSVRRDAIGGVVAPVSLVNIKICLYLIKDGALHVEELAVCGLDIRTNNVHNDPFLILPLRYGRMPVFDLFLHSRLVQVVILNTSSGYRYRLFTMFTSHVTT